MRLNKQISNTCGAPTISHHLKSLKERNLKVSMYHVKYLKFSYLSNIQLKIFMVFLTMYYMSWGLSYFYENSQLEIRQCNTIYAMRTSDGRFISIESEFSNYLFYRNFFIFTYIMKIFMVFLTMYYMSWGLGYFYESSQLESDNVM